MSLHSESDADSQVKGHSETQPKEASPTAKILVIEDEPGLRRLLRYCLERAGYQVLDAATGAEGIDIAITYNPNAVLLDMSLPDLHGLVVLNRLREWTQVPILMLSESNQEAEKIAALDGGANDYVTKPFSTAELVARVRVTQRYAQPARTEVFRLGDLSVDLANRMVTVKGKRAKLTPTEYSLLRLFVQNAGKVLTHRQIFHAVWGPAETDKVEYIRVYLTSLRNKLARELIVTEPGIGYRLAIQN